eukprot:TRINITY_DN981_c0_g2_i7.p1 TRINITY_DN981_c0_g2~~TRINITY_DN981_c0_g2_i7.p1  ORF type:complete len:709 (-),score=147.59 TRINITY_DN981_c0_g2_i7:1785-3911(-)
MADAVRVAVRVRPFNQREKDRNAKLIIQMDGNMTTITNPETEEEKRFSYDFSYWSHDGFIDQDGLMVPENDKYADQQCVFNDLGRDVLDNAFKGFNCSLFAYGQTGSGKSYSMVGYGKNKGIVPISCEEIFKYIDQNTDPRKEFRVSCSMLEIYNEQVRDLMSRDNPKGGLKVRNLPKLGVQVMGLLEVPVQSYEEIEMKIEEGTSNRTIAATNMNATSSRAHTVVAILFTQVEKDARGPGKDREITSKINLVDLAGSERADSTGATGDRLKEGSMINLSLTMLGNVITALAEKSSNPNKKILVPYRDSKLTQILQDALGGNSKTIMIAALSPANINYEETLSTLRYADRAKKIKNKAVVNVDPKDLLILNLQEDNKRLLEQLEQLRLMIGGGVSSNPVPMSDEEKTKMRSKMDQMAEELRENQKMVEDQNKSWNEKLREAEDRTRQLELQQQNHNTAQMLPPHHSPTHHGSKRHDSRAFNHNGAPLVQGPQGTISNSATTGRTDRKSDSTSHNTVAAKQQAQFVDPRKQFAHLRNVNEDPMLSNKVVWLLDKKLTTVGRKETIPEPSISLAGLNIMKEHAVIKQGKPSEFNITALEGARVLVNGKPLPYGKKHPLSSNDRILFGANHLYIFVNPTQGVPEKIYDWDMAQEEIAKEQGFDLSQDNLHNDVVAVLPLIHEANAISKDINKATTFEIKILSKFILGKVQV